MLRPLSIHAQRGTSPYDRWYFYDPLDWVFGSVRVTNSTIVIGAGTAIGTFNATNYGGGFTIDNSVSIVSESSSPALPIILAHCNTVQEQATTNWSGAGAMMIY